MKNAAAENGINVSGSLITEERDINLGTGGLVIPRQPSSRACYLEKDWLIPIEASTLRLNDEFMQYQPCTIAEQTFKDNIAQAIHHGVKDFHRPKFDPSFHDSGEGIFYGPHRKPALDMPYEWWDLQAKLFWPERNSRLSSRNEHFAFLGIFIKRMTALGVPIAKAWHDVCYDSEPLGCFYNSRGSTSDAFGCALTGSCQSFGFCDLANTRKILAWDDTKGCYWIVQACCSSFSKDSPLCFMASAHDKKFIYRMAVGSIICD